MGRHKKIAAPAVADEANTPALANAMTVVRADANATALAATQQGAKVRALALQLRYEGATDPSTLENSAREAIRRIGMGIFELGAYLLLLREVCPHGSFTHSLERLGLQHEAARRYMQVTARFSKSSSTRTLEAAGVTKMAELLVLDTDQVDELLLTGQTGELALDDVVTMSVKELRAAVRELREDVTATQAVLTKKNERIDKLERDRQRFAKMPPDDALKAMLDAANGVMLDIRGGVHGQLRMAAITIREHCSNHGGDQAAQDVALAGMVGSIAKALADLRQELNLPDVSNAADQQLLAEIAQWDKPEK